MELGHRVTDDLAACCAIATIATQGLPQHRDTGVMLHDQRQHPLVEVRAMIPTRAWGDGHNLFVRGFIAMRAAIDMATRRIEMGDRGRQPQTRGSGGGNEALECRHAIGVERIEGTSEGVIMAMAGLNAGGNKARARFMLEKMGAEIELLVHEAQAVEDHGLDRMAGGHHPHARVLFGGLIKDLRDAECFKHPCD